MSSSLHRPPSIRWFQKLYLAYALLAFLVTIVFYSPLRAWMIAQDGAPGLLIVTAAMTLGIRLLLRYFVASRASNGARWILLAITGLDVASSALRAHQFVEIGTAYAVASFLLACLAIAACTFLLRPDASDWLTGGGPVDPSTFD